MEYDEQNGQMEFFMCNLTNELRTIKLQSRKNQSNQQVYNNNHNYEVNDVIVVNDCDKQKNKTKRNNQNGMRELLTHVNAKLCCVCVYLSVCVCVQLCL